MEEDQTNFGKVCLLKDEKSDSAVQCEDKKINFIEQFVSEVLDFSSQYGKDTSISYTAYNLTGKPSKFPDYGDFPQVFVMVGISHLLVVETLLFLTKSGL